MALSRGVPRRQILGKKRRAIFAAAGCTNREGTMKSRTTSSNAIRMSVVLFIILATPVLLCAQTAKVTGTVADSSGAVVVGATVTATNQATSIERSTSTTDTGAYT